jgi:hypothetical protein
MNAVNNALKSYRAKGCDPNQIPEWVWALLRGEEVEADDTPPWEAFWGLPVKPTPIRPSEPLPIQPQPGLPVTAPAGTLPFGTSPSTP